MNDLDAKFIRFRTVGGANCDCSDTDHQMCWASKYCQKQKSVLYPIEPFKVSVTNGNSERG